MELRQKPGGRGNSGTKFLVWNFTVQAQVQDDIHHYWTAIGMGGYADNHSQQLPG